MTRSQEIESALAKLGGFRADPAYADRQYAIDANTAFLKAARSLSSYLWWLFTVAPKLDGSRLLELTDFPVEEWDVAMHSRLIELQRRKQPGLVAPLVAAITDYIQHESRDLIMADFGAGGMEVDRQVAEWAVRANGEHLLTIVAVDKSAVTRNIARKNLETLQGSVDVVETGEIDAAELERLRRAATKNVLIVMCTNDIFHLPEQFPAHSFDLIYHSLFKHHLTPEGQETLDAVIRGLAKKHLEFDGFKSWPVTLPQTVVGWNYPHFLNGETFSNLRFKDRKDREVYARERGNIEFFSATGFYLLEYR